MKVLIVGSNGMLGNELFLRYGFSNHKVVGLDHNSLDITNSSTTLDRIAAERPDWVILTAAYTKVDECEKKRDRAWAVNAEGTLNVAKACRLISSRLCFISTDYIFNGNNSGPYSEEDIPDPINYYAVTKLAGENYARKELSDCLIIRTSWLFGSRGRNFVNTILEKAQIGDSLKVVSDQIGAPTYTKDLADIIFCLLDNHVRGIVNVTNDGYCSWFDFAKTILATARKFDIEILPITSDSLNLSAKRPPNSRLDLTKLHQIIGKNMRSWKDALEDFIKEIPDGK
tara:strand:+ start:97 stop:951 length:855 start_codon:yes stop_codon:yes gene_type:complete